MGRLGISKSVTFICTRMEWNTYGSRYTAFDIENPFRRSGFLGLWRTQLRRTFRNGVSESIIIRATNECIICIYEAGWEMWIVHKQGGYVASMYVMYI